MNIILDVSEAFGAIDYDNAGGLTSYIDIKPTTNFHEKLSFRLLNFVLNLIDEPVTDTISKQAPPAFTKKFTEDGLLIVKCATITFEQLKSYESLLSLIDEKNKRILHNSWGEDLCDGDKIYDIGGRLTSNPDLLLNLSIVSPRKITVTFSLEDCIYTENYANFRHEVKILNTKMETIKNTFTGKLFDINLSNSHMPSNWDGGYRTYIQNKKNN
jgi:hypothetical protein